MIIEFREYTCHPGKRDSWVKLMEERIVPYQAAKGMAILALWVSETDPNLFYWMRRFENEDVRKAQYDAVYKNDIWRNEFAPLVEEHLDRSKIKVTRMIPTRGSVIQ
jgi:quinol monooxygenase YgiN